MQASINPIPVAYFLSHYEPKTQPEALSFKPSCAEEYFYVMIILIYTACEL